MTGVRTVPTFVRELASHVRTASRLVHDTPSGPSRGAANLAAVAAYLLAATEAESEAEHANKVAALRDHVAALRWDRRQFRAALIDAALAAEVDVRAARGAPVYGGRLRGWMDPTASAPLEPMAADTAAGASVAPAIPDVVMRACAEAEALDDVDGVLLDVLKLTRSLKLAAQRGVSRQALLDAYEAAALRLCIGPAAPGVDDARFLLLHTWMLLRRKRSIAAAIIRARARWARTACEPEEASMATDEAGGT